MKKHKIAVVFIALLLIMLTGCENKKQQTKEDEPLTILLISNSPMEKALRKQFPDINFAFKYYDGINQTSNFEMSVKNHDITDIYTGTLLLNEKEASENLIDLSGYEFCDNYEPSILDSYDINGSIYQLPGSVTIRCIIYNKEMFAEHGWKEPRTFGELTALCRQIREETDNITPIVFGGAANGYYFTTMTTYAQTEFLYTPEGKKWQKEYFKGNAKAEDGFGSGIRMTQELIDAGAFDYEKNVDDWDANIFTKRMVTEEAAMQFAWGVQHKLFGMVDSEKKFGVLPFYNYDGDAFLGTAISDNIGLSKRLKEKGNEKKLKDALRVVEWYATEEGLSELTKVNGSVIYPLKHAKNSQTIPQFRELWNGNLDGIKAPMLYAGYEDILNQTADYIIEAIKGEHDLSGLASMIDEIHQSVLKENKNNSLAYIGRFSQDFTHEETVQMITEILHAKGDSDITLVSDGERVGNVKNTEGAHSKFYEGPIIYDWGNISIPGSSDSDNFMVQMTLNGAQIQELLENGKHMVLYDGSNATYPVASDENALDSSTYPYYWAGMHVKWKNGKVLSMTLNDGTPIKKDKTYTVSFAAEDYMDTTAEAGNPVKLPYNAYSAFCEYMKEHSPVSPVKVKP